MKFIQDVLKQPEQDDVLIRYMDQWKYDSIVKEGLVFTKVSHQSDSFDGIMFYDDSGYASFNNNHHKNGYRSCCYISCWTLDNQPSLEKFNEYCREKDKTRYAIKTTYKKLTNFCINQCKEINGNYLFSRTFFIIYGKVEYIYYKQIKNTGIKPWDNGLSVKVFFYKDKEKYEHESEFRILLLLSSAKLKPNDNNYIIDSYRGHDKIKCIYGEKPDFIDSIYECSPEGKIREIEF